MRIKKTYIDHGDDAEFTIMLSSRELNDLWWVLCHDALENNSDAKKFEAAFNEAMYPEDAK